MCLSVFGRFFFKGEEGHKRVFYKGFSWVHFSTFFFTKKTIFLEFFILFDGFSQGVKDFCVNRFLLLKVLSKGFLEQFFQCFVQRFSLRVLFKVLFKVFVSVFTRECSERVSQKSVVYQKFFFCFFKGCYDCFIFSFCIFISFHLFFSCFFFLVLFLW